MRVMPPVKVLRTACAVVATFVQPRVAFEKQLGLQLRKIQDVDVDILVVDRADKDPVEN